MSRATKYRPTNFDTIVGQEHIKSILQQQVVDTGTKSNYLFFGPRGTGKTSTARILAKALNCTNLQDGNPCNECPSCKLIDEGKTLDFVEIDAASHTGVDNIREEIIEKALYHPTNLKKKIYIIDEVHMLSKGAFNALLKIMEEPPAFMTFILATTEIHKIPETIISRCQVFQFKKFSVEQIMGRLQHIAKQEGVTAEPEALKLIAKLAEGIMRDANKFLEQVSILGDVTVENVSTFLGVAGDQQIEKLLQQIQSQDRDAINISLEELQQGGIDLSQFAKQTLGYINEHFMESPDFYAAMTQVFTDIIMNSKYFPHPLLTYKTKIYNYLQGGDIAIGPDKKKPQTKPVAKSTTVTSSPEDTKKPTHEVKKEKPTHPTDVISTEVEKSQDTNTISSSNTQPEKKIEKKESPASVSPTQSDNQTGETDQSADKGSSSNNKSTSDFDSIKSQIVEKIESNTMKTMLDKSAIIKDISEDTLSLLVINKMAELSLNKDDNKQNIERILSDVMDKPMKIAVSYMPKEDYFASLM